MADYRESFKVEGLRELSQLMQKLPVEVARKHLVKGLKAGAKPVRDEAEARAPVLKEPDPRRRAGTLKRNIRIATVRQTDHDAAVKVGVRKLGAKAITAFKFKQWKAGRGIVGGAFNPDDPFYARFVEFGTSKMGAQPFLRPALYAQKETAIERMRQNLKPNVEAEARRMAWHKPGG